MLIGFPCCCQCGKLGDKTEYADAFSSRDSKWLPAAYHDDAHTTVAGTLIAKTGTRFYRYGCAPDYGGTPTYPVENEQHTVEVAFADWNNTGVSWPNSQSMTLDITLYGDVVKIGLFIPWAGGTAYYFLYHPYHGWKNLNTFPGDPVPAKGDVVRLEILNRGDGTEGAEDWAVRYLVNDVAVWEPDEGVDGPYLNVECCPPHNTPQFWALTYGLTAELYPGKTVAYDDLAYTGTYGDPPDP